MSGVRRIRSDQCQHAQESDLGNPVKKPTGFMSNAAQLLGALDRRCFGRKGLCSRPGAASTRIALAKPHAELPSSPTRCARRFFEESACSSGVTSAYDHLSMAFATSTRLCLMGTTKLSCVALGVNLPNQGADPSKPMRQQHRTINRTQT